MLKVLKTGLQVSYSGNLKGFVNEDYLLTPLSKLKNFEEGSQYPARVLYVTPNKVVYFTMDASVCAAEVPTSPFTFIKLGDIILKAKVNVKIYVNMLPNSEQTYDSNLL